MTIQPLSDERLAEIRAGGIAGLVSDNAEAALVEAAILALLARLDKAEAGLRGLRQAILDAELICDDGDKCERFISQVADSIRRLPPSPRNIDAEG